MSDLEIKLAEAREGIMPNDVSEMAASHRRAFDACAAIAREVVAKKDDEIAQALDDLARWESIARDSIKYGLKRDAEIARLRDEMKSDPIIWVGDEGFDRFAIKMMLAQVAEHRKVTDAQREAIREALSLWWGDSDDTLGASDKRLMDRIVAILESTDEPAAK